MAGMMLEKYQSPDLREFEIFLGMCEQVFHVMTTAPKFIAKKTCAAYA